MPCRPVDHFLRSFEFKLNEIYPHILRSLSPNRQPSCCVYSRGSTLLPPKDIRAKHLYTQAPKYYAVYNTGEDSAAIHFVFTD